MQTEFPVFRVGYGDHSSWDMVWLRIDYNGHGFDAFVTDINLGRTRVSYTMPNFPKPNEWVHLALAWDETTGIRFYVNGKLAGEKAATGMFDAALDQFGPHSRIIAPDRRRELLQLRPRRRHRRAAHLRPHALGRQHRLARQGRDAAVDSADSSATLAQPRLAEGVVVPLRLEPAQRHSRASTRRPTRPSAKSRSTTPTT